MEGIFGYGMSGRGLSHEALTGTREVSAHCFLESSFWERREEALGGRSGRWSHSRTKSICFKIFQGPWRWPPFTWPLEEKVLPNSFLQAEKLFLKLSSNIELPKVH